MKASLCLEAAERPQWPRLYLLSRPRSRGRMPSLVGDRGQVLRVLDWALTRIRNLSLVRRCGQWRSQAGAHWGTCPTNCRRACKLSTPKVPLSTAIGCYKYIKVSNLYSSADSYQKSRAVRSGERTRLTVIITKSRTLP